jgi:hypothetical protein
MNKFLLLLTFFSVSALADFKKIKVDNLDLDYVSPSGKGMVERVGIGLSLTSEPYPIEINRTQDTFELTSPYVDFTWNQPLKMIYDLDAVTTKQTSAGLGTTTHYVTSEFMMIRTKNKNEYKAEKIQGKCEGGAQGTFDVRLLEDCRKKMDFTIHRLEVPGSFILNHLIESLPRPSESELDIPADNLVLSVKEGDFSMVAYIKFWFYAGLRASGHVQFENEHKIVAIRIDQVKFGYLAVTNLVLKKLKEMIKDPDVKVDPPWIRISTKRFYESQ